MNISRLLQVMCVSMFVAGPALASPTPISSDSSIPLCGEKAESAKKDQPSDTVVKTEKKDEKKDEKAKKAPAKDSA